MTLLMNGTSTLISSVTNIIESGFWIWIGEKEYFVPFSDYPSFKKATIDQILSMQIISPNQMRWEALDIDIELSALNNPEHFPLHFIE